MSSGVLIPLVFAGLMNKVLQKKKLYLFFFLNIYFKKKCNKGFLVFRELRAHLRKMMA